MRIRKIQNEPVQSMLVAMQSQSEGFVPEAERKSTETTMKIKRFGRILKRLLKKISLNTNESCGISFRNSSDEIVCSEM